MYVVCGWDLPGIAFHLTLGTRGSWTRRPCGAALLIGPAVLKTIFNRSQLKLRCSASTRPRDVPSWLFPHAFERPYAFLGAKLQPITQGHGSDFLLSKQHLYLRMA
jgi:hypothetical protein